VVVVVVDAAVLEPEQVLELPQRVRRLPVELQLPLRMVRLLPEPVEVAVGVADVVARVAAALLPNRLHDSQMEP
jgi:hypothetical protein